MTNYSNEITNELVSEYGKGILSSSHKSPLIPVRIAQRISNRYPAIQDSTAFRGYVSNPKGVVIAKRYMSLVMGVK